MHVHTRASVCAHWKTETGGMEKKRGFKQHWQALALFLGQWQEAYSTDARARTHSPRARVQNILNSIYCQSSTKVLCDSTREAWQISHRSAVIFPHRPRPFTPPRLCLVASVLSLPATCLSLLFPAQTSSTSCLWQSQCAPDLHLGWGSEGLCVFVCVCGGGEWAHRSKGVTHSLSSHHEPSCMCASHGSERCGSVQHLFMFHVCRYTNPNIKSKGWAPNGRVVLILS